MEVTLKKVRCVICGYKWIPRVSKPKRCPKCQSYYWRSSSRILKEINCLE